MKTLLLQRICSSHAAGIATAEALLGKRELDDEAQEEMEGADFTALADESLHQLRQRQRHLHELRVQHQAATNRLHALSYDPRADARVQASLELIAQTLTDEVTRFETDQDQLSQQALEHVQQQMQRVMGIGPASAKALSIATNGFAGFESAKAVAKYVGLAPEQAQSGTSVRRKGKLVGTSVGYVRGVLYMAARSARRYNLNCKALYERLRGRGKCHRVAMIAPGRRCGSQQVGSSGVCGCERESGIYQRSWPTQRKFGINTVKHLHLTQYGDWKRSGRLSA